jgi:hypothetical protein
MLSSSPGGIRGDNDNNNNDINPDPREWTRRDVRKWLENAGIQYQLAETHPDRFPMNGKGLLLLTRDMFIDRVPIGGALLYEDLHLKLQKIINDQFRHSHELEIMLRSGLINN